MGREAEKELLVAADTLLLCTHLVDRYASTTVGRQLSKVFVDDLRPYMYRLLYRLQLLAKKVRFEDYAAAFRKALAEANRRMQPV